MKGEGKSCVSYLLWRHPRHLHTDIKLKFISSDGIYQGGDVIIVKFLVSVVAVHGRRIRGEDDLCLK